MDDIKPYLKATDRQLSYLAYLCSELGITNRSLYEPYTMIRANKEIKRLRKSLDKQALSVRQVVLL